jgi:hypothetical protein
VRAGRAIISLDALAAFLAGVGSILGAGYSLRRVRREERKDCAERIAQLDAAYHRGIDEGLDLSRRRDA